MKTEWDYTTLADAYLKRPDYSDEAIDKMLAITSIPKTADVCDVGAGVAHLTIKLAERGYNVVAVEPNDSMRKNGIARTASFRNARWVEGTGENTGLSEKSYDLVTFGSSFNVTNRELALLETARILKPRGWFACMWNHRDLNEPLQAKIEQIIKTNITDYSYGSRREDQTSVIDKSKLFGEVIRIEGVVYHEQSKEHCLEAWRSHATLHRQSGDEKFKKIIKEIEELLNQVPSMVIRIPYTTKIWLARLK